MGASPDTTLTVPCNHEQWPGVALLKKRQDNCRERIEGCSGGGEFREEVKTENWFINSVSLHSVHTPLVAIRCPMLSPTTTSRGLKRIQWTVGLCPLVKMPSGKPASHTTMPGASLGSGHLTSAPLQACVKQPFKQANK